MYCDAMAVVRLETLVEPFKENQPGPHVQAVLDSLTSAGLEPDMGPFATTADGDVDVVAGAVADAIRAAVREGATAVQFRIEVPRA